MALLPNLQLFLVMPCIRRINPIDRYIAFKIHNTRPGRRVQSGVGRKKLATFECIREMAFSSRSSLLLKFLQLRADAAEYIPLRRAGDIIFLRYTASDPFYRYLGALKL